MLFSALSKNPFKSDLSLLITNLGTSLKLKASIQDQKKL